MLQPGFPLLGLPAAHGGDKDRPACGDLGPCYPTSCRRQSGLTGVDGEKAEKPLSIQGGDLAIRIHVTFLSLCVVFCVASFCPHSDPLREVAVLPILPMRKQARGREGICHRACLLWSRPLSQSQVSCVT